MSKLFESQFSDSTGTVSIQYEGTEGTSEAQVAADCNCGEDRTIAVSVESEDGSVKKTLTVNQEGVREQFIPAGETEGIICSDGLRFLTIKEKYAGSMIECCVPFNGNIIYIDQTISDPALMITGDVNGDVIQWIRQNSHRVLAKKTADGKITYCRLKDDDGTKYYDGSAADLTGTEGDVFVKLPTFYYYGTEGDNVELHFAKEKLDDNYIEWDTNILIGAYEAHYSSKLRSISGVESSGNISQANFKTYATARGEGYQLIDWQMHCVLGCLYYAMYGNTDCQAAIGKGANSYQKINGETDALGMTDTVAGSNGDSGSINFWGLENWWGNKLEWLEDYENAAGTLAATVNDPVNGGTRQLDIPLGGYDSYPKKMKFGRYLDLIVTDDAPKKGSDSVGYCDYQWWPGSTSSSTRVVRRSSFFSSTTGGVAFASAGYTSSNTDTLIGSRLAFRGVTTEAESVTAFKALPDL